GPACDAGLVSVLAANSHFSLINPQLISKPVGNDLLSNRRIIVLAMLCACLILGEETQGDIEPMLLTVVIDFAGLRHSEHIMTAVQHEIRTTHVLQVT